MTNVLISFAEGASACERFTRPGWRVLLDSGAYANHTSKKPVVTLEQYRAYLLEHGHRYFRYFNLDVIGDPAQSARNLAALEEAGLKPIPVFQRGGTSTELKAMLARHELVGIGGIAGRLKHKSHMDYLEQVMATAGTDRRRTHLLGCGDQRVLGRFSPYSADSSGAANRMGDLKLYYKNKFCSIGLKGTLKLNGKDDMATIAAALAAYGVPLSTALDQRVYGGSAEGSLLNARSYLRFQKLMRERFGIEYFIVASLSYEKFQAAVDAESGIASIPVSKPAEATLGGSYYLVGCGKDKQAGRHKARDLYTGDLFKKAMAYGTARGRVLILSAEHGVVHPDQELDDYDRTLADMTAAEEAVWGDRVMAQLRATGATRFVGLAGSTYLNPLRERGLEVEDPMAGLGIGMRLKWLKENT